MDIILKDLNTCIEKINRYCTLRAVKPLPNRDFAILTMNNKEAKKLWSKIQLVGVLGNNTSVVIKTYGIRIIRVNIADFDMTNKK